MEQGLLVILFYGMFHALAPDHLSAIALFSIGKNRLQSAVISLLFAFGHGVTLLFLAYIISYIANPDILDYGDKISSLVIILMGIYMLYLAISNKITISFHLHKKDDDENAEEKHVHIHYKEQHLHDRGMVLSLGILMGIGGVRGVLVTLGAVGSQSIGYELVLSFVAGVSIVFLIFGYLIYLLNQQLTSFREGHRYFVASIGLVSMMFGTYTLSGSLL